MLETPQITRTDARPTAVIRLTVPRTEIRNVMEPARIELLDALAAQGVAPDGPWFTHHLRMDPDVFDFEIGLPVREPLSAIGRVITGEWPATRVARAELRGDYAGLPAAWAELDAWLASAGHTPAADLWERYLVGPESSADPASWRTELNRPLAATGPTPG